MNPSKFYNSQLEKQRDIKRKLSKKSNFYSTFRVTVFLVFIVAIIFELNERELQAVLLLTILLGVILAFLIKSHNKVKARLTMASNLVKLSNIELERIIGSYEKIDNGLEFNNDQHPYSSDLDFFGNNSIFQFINQTTSFFGKKKLAAWLLNNVPIAEIGKRQRAAEELSENQAWCLDYRATGLSDHIDEKEVSSFKGWLHQEPKLLGKSFLKWTTIILPLLISIIIAGAFIFDYTLYSTVPFLVISGFLLSRQHKYASQTVNSTYQSLKTLQVLAKQLVVLEQSNFNSNYLIELKNSVASGKGAAIEIERLHKLLENLQARNGTLHPIFNIPFLLDIQWLLKLEEWRQENAAQIEQWFETLATTECLVSLSGLYFNHPEWTTPTFSDDPYYLNATELTHPMLGSNGIPNNFSFTGIGNTNLITGPNMAGKSTFLRTVATSWVFAQIGAPIRAKNFVINPKAEVFTAMRVKDNLSESVSSFYAELDRIKHLIDKVKSGEQCLYFLDEILKGTNSADRHKGAEALIRQLHKLKASGFISTHDLELGELAAKEKFVKNFSFESDIAKGQITFDYTIKDGICSSFNACELMRQMGIEVD
jgi:DNA mismatch repair ATPase MutS